MRSASGTRFLRVDTVLWAGKIMENYQKLQNDVDNVCEVSRKPQECAQPRTRLGFR
jgi:acyl carrier protein phosphodiesterase